MWSGNPPARGGAKEFSRSLNGLGVSLPVHTTETKAETELLQVLPDLSSLESLVESASIRPMGPAALGIGPRIVGEVGSEVASDCESLTACGPSPSRQAESNRNISAMDCMRILSCASSGANSDAETLVASLGAVSMPQLKDIGLESAEQETSDLLKLLESAGQDGLLVSSTVYASVSVPQTTPFCRNQPPFGGSIRVPGVQSTTDQREGDCCDESAESEVCHISLQLCGERHGALSSTGSICTTTSSCAAFSRRRRSVAELTAAIPYSDLRSIFEYFEARKFEQVLVPMPSLNRSKNFKAS